MGDVHKPGVTVVGMEIRLVDSNQVRRELDREFAVYAHPMPWRLNACTYVPEGELWIAKEFEQEADRLLILSNLEREHLKADTHFPEFRSWANIELCDPARFDLKRATLDLKEFGTFVIRYVDGSIVRGYCDEHPGIDCYITSGAHPFVSENYARIVPAQPKAEIWIDGRTEYDHGAITEHEWVEMQLMSRFGLTYDIAHRYATDAEIEWLSQHGIAQPGDEQPPIRSDFPMSTIARLLCEREGAEYWR